MSDANGGNRPSYGRILLIFVGIIVSAGFVLGILANVLTGQ